MMPYFHVRLSVVGERHDEVKIDLDAETLEQQFLAPYREGRTITVNGRAVTPEKIDRIRISRSDQPAEHFRPAIEAADRASTIVVMGGPGMRWRMAARATDVTDEHVLGPPGYGAVAQDSSGSEPKSDREDDMPYTAAACQRGHLIATDVVDPENRRRLPGRRGIEVPQSETVAAFCGHCSARVLTACESCGTPVPVPVQWGEQAHRLVSFCVGCGKAFPWATREERIGQLYNLLDFEEGLGESDRLEVADAIAILSEPEQDEENEQLVRAGETFKRLAPKAWASGVPVLQGVLQEWLKKKLGLS
jgi:hypothetical protein